MSYNNKQFSEIIENLSNDFKNEIINRFFNLFGRTIKYSRFNLYFYMSGHKETEEFDICAEYTYGNLIYDQDEINELSDEGFLKIIKKFIKGKYYLSMDISNQCVSFEFDKYKTKEILELKNMNIYKNYWKYNEKYHADFIKNQRYLYTLENLDELTYDKLFKLVNNDQYMKINYFNNMKKFKYDLCFRFF